MNLKLHKKVKMIKKLILVPISLFFECIVGFRNYLYTKKILNITKSNIPIISVGNIEVGGTGKTPFVISICKLLLDRQLNPLVITRGYNRKNKKSVYINKNSYQKFSANEIGDEPVHILAKLNGIDMIVDHNKSRAVLYANQLKNVDFIVLDDGFQSRYINKTIDIVLLNMKRPKKMYQLLPAGILREPIKSLKRSHLQYIIKGKDKLNLGVKKLNSNYTIYKYMNSKKEKISVLEDNCRLLSCCGIGDPLSFHETLKNLNINIAETLVFQNHVHYTKKRLILINEKLINCDGLITTYKDFVKFDKNFINNNLIYVVDINIVIDDKKLIDLIKTHE